MKDYEKTYEDSRSVNEMTESAGWTVVSHDIEEYIQQLQSEMDDMITSIPSQIQKGKSSEALFIRIATLQAEISGLKKIFELVEYRKKLQYESQKKL